MNELKKIYLKNGNSERQGSELPQPKGIEASFDHLRRDLLAQHMPEQERGVVGSALRKSLSQGQPVNIENNVDTNIDFAMKGGTIHPSAKSERVFSTPLPHVHQELDFAHDVERYLQMRGIKMKMSDGQEFNVDIYENINKKMLKVVWFLWILSALLSTSVMVALYPTLSFSLLLLLSALLTILFRVAFISILLHFIRKFR